MKTLKKIMGSSPLKLKTELEILLHNKLQESQKENDKRKKENIELRDMIQELKNHVKTLSENNIKPSNQSFHTDEEELECETGEIGDLAPDTKWIRVRRNKNMKKRKMDQSLSPLTDEDQLVIQHQKQEKKSEIISKIEKKPFIPPIIVEGVKDYNDLCCKITSKVNKENFKTKMLKNDSIKILPRSGEDHRFISTILNEDKSQWYSFENKQERPLRVMVKNLSHTIPPQSIVDELKEKGFQCLEAVNKIGWRSKEPLDMFIISFKSNQDSKEVFEIKNIMNMIVEVEELKRNKLLVQCKRCQSYGHTHNYCKKTARCVKCAGMHETQSCNKPKSETAKCIHCGQGHPASYRGCYIAKELQKIKILAEIPKKLKSYAEITAGNKPQPAAKNQQLKIKPIENKENDINKALQLILSRLDSFDARISNLEASIKGAIPKTKSS